MCNQKKYAILENKKHKIKLAKNINIKLLNTERIKPNCQKVWQKI